MRRVARADLPLAVALAVELALLFALPRVVTIDGPAHLLGGWVLAHPSDPLLTRWYRIDLSPVPNLLTTVLLAGLLRVTGPDLAEQLLVAAILVLLPLALRAALRAVDARAGWLAVLAVPFSTGYLLLYGFYNLFLGVGLALLVASLALRRRPGWSVAAAVGLAALLLLTWTAHLLPALVAGLLVAVLALARTAADGPSSWRRHLLPVALAGLPVAVLTVAFGLSDAAGRGRPEHAGLGSLVVDLLALRAPLVAYSPWEQLPAAVLAALLAALAVQAARQAARPVERPGESAARPGDSADRRALAAATGLVTAWYLLSPARYGPQYGLLNDRLALFPPLLLSLWVATGRRLRPGVRRAAVAVVLAATALLAGLRLPTELRYQREVAELVSVASHVPRHVTLVAVQLSRDPPSGGRVRNPYRDPLRHESSRIAVLRDDVDLGLYEAATGYFPVRFRRPTYDPALLAQVPPPPGLDLGSAADVVLVLGRQRARGQAAVLRGLEPGYRRAAVSRTGLVEVWLRR